MIWSKILEKIVLPIGDFLNGSSFITSLKYWRGVDQFSEMEIHALQKENLSKIIKHAVANTVHYKNIKLSGSDPYQWLLSFPILTKNDLREKLDDMLSEDKKKLTKLSSSGSSGVSSTVYMNSKDLSLLRAGLIHWWEWSGYRIGAPLVQTGISPKRGLLKAIKDKLFRTIYINAFSHSKEQLRSLCLKLEKSKNYFLVGYASSLNVIAEYASSNNHNIRLKGVISLGDKLFLHYRKNITSTFLCKVYDTYGSAEGFLIGAEADLEYMYILSPQTFVEILDDNDNPVPDGKMGNIVVTRLDGFAMPLIRYKIGDIGSLLPKGKYPEKRKYSYPLLERIVGRNTDIVKTKSGKSLVVHAFTGVFEYISEIKQFKVIQYNTNGVLIEYIKADGFSSKILDNIVFELQKHLKEPSFNIQFKEVQNMEPTKSGKPQIIKSYL